MSYRVAFITIVPSPYQRDLFGALAGHPEIKVEVYYLESSSPDFPWPEKPLRPFEHVLPGLWLPFGRARIHINFGLPDLGGVDFVVISSFTSLTGQWLMRRALRKKRWMFWGERLTKDRGLKGWFRRQLIKPMRKACAIVGIGQVAELDYRSRLPTLPHFSIPYHCELVEFFEIDRRLAPVKPVTFLFCGQMISRKGVDLLLLAFDRLVSEGAEAKLLLVGREAQLPQFLDGITSAARKQIQYEGFQAPEQLPKYFAKADVFVLPSRHDGWGVVVNQAMAAGMPIITSDAVGAGIDYVSSGINGWCVQAGDADALYGALKVFVDDPGTVRRWGEAARDRARTLTPEQGAEKWVRVFNVLEPTSDRKSKNQRAGNLKDSPKGITAL